ncbi:uncharacterized protein LOC109708733, partial [Ananas comosus]|uniref:Uncharacterized protein LOC109708733 n=1 Tax=Ananas comosus TaxID=4615 RepID=A0A6P5ERJ6_ANACO
LCVLEEFHAEPVQINSHNYHRDCQRHKQAVAPVILNGSQNWVLIWWKELGYDSSVEEDQK